MTHIVESVEACVDAAIEAVGNHLVIGAPLGLGKPVQLLNAFYQRALDDPSLSLHIYTALCLERPVVQDDISAHLSEPIVQRLFGDYEDMAFVRAQREARLPANVTLSELYFKAGARKHVADAQQHYISSNYTHIARDMLDRGVNILTQLIAARGEGDQTRLSLSCNTDITLEIFDVVAQQNRPLLTLAQVHDDLPFMLNDAEVDIDCFDWIVRSPRYNRTLFGVPNTAVPLRDYATALHASSLIDDGGTLQIGIGALGDAVAQACIVRHHNNEHYNELLRSLAQPASGEAERILAPFDEGLYASTEMFVNGMMHLIDHGIIKRQVYDQLDLQRGINAGQIAPVVDERLHDYVRDCGLMPRELSDAALDQLKYWAIIGDNVCLRDGQLDVAGELYPNDTDNAGTKAALLASASGNCLRHGHILHAGFFLGPSVFYQRLRALDDAAQARLCMTGVRRTNQLLLDYPLYSAQRRGARFINTGMMVSLSGAVTSDALEDGTVISGVGGQYNFVAMAHDLPGARSILCIRSTRGEGRQMQSNVVPYYGHTTIPRHLRDVIVTEYGVADLRGQDDAEVIKRLLNITDSRFQQPLLDFAKNHGKLPDDYRIPLDFRDNTPARLQRALQPHIDSGLLPDYPFGTELSAQEIALSASLRNIQSLSEEPAYFIARSLRALLHRPDDDAARPFLRRIQLEHPETTREFLLQQLLLLDLQERGLLKAG